MTYSTNNSRDVALHPSIAADHALSMYSTLCRGSIETDLIRLMVWKLLPPPDIRVFASAVGILAEIGLVPETDAELFSRIGERGSDDPAFNQRAPEKPYPVCFAILRLYENGRDFPVTRDKSIQVLLASAQRHPPREKFTGHVYYKHVISLRDAVDGYWQEAREARKRGDRSRGDRWADLVEFIEKQQNSATSKKNAKLKFGTASHLLNEDLVLGRAWPRGQIERKRRCQVGSRVSVSEAVAAEADATTYVQSAVVDEPFLDDDGLIVEIQYPDGATTLDKQRVIRGAVAGFARTNVRTVSDMNACSAVTYSDYLTHAYATLPDAEYSLTWLSAFAGIDVSRQLTIGRNDGRMPFADHVVADRSVAEIRYNVLRRRSQAEPDIHETAGIMRLPVPQRVHCGLLEICDMGNQGNILASCDSGARAFSQKHSGLTPTLRRLRASARIFVAPKKFSELEFNAISGRVAPALKGISAYYPHRVVPLARKFALAYEDVLTELAILAPIPDELASLADGPDDQLFCQPSPGMPAVRELMYLVSSAYEGSCARLESKGLLASIEDLIGAVTLHETACYVLQQIALGIRPIGEVADFFAASAEMGALTTDKGSRLFAERSFSPLTQRHSHLLSCAAENRQRLRDVLGWSGHRLVNDEAYSSLACRFQPVPGENAYQCSRLTNNFFRYDAPVASTAVDSNYMPNWLRHVAAEDLKEKAYQWQLDEFLGHRRIGREVMVKWSTAGTSHFESLRMCIEDVVSELVDDVLLRPVPTFYSGLTSKWR